jgi:hypothetical protein
MGCTDDVLYQRAARGELGEGRVDVDRGGLEGIFSNIQTTKAWRENAAEQRRTRRAENYSPPSFRNKTPNL